MPRQRIIGNPLDSGKRVYDLVKWEVHKEYCRGTIALTAGDYQIGQVIANATQAPEANGAEPPQSDVLLLWEGTVPAGETWDLPALCRGPALVDLDQVVRATPDETDAALITRLADLTNQGVRFHKEPVHRTRSGYELGGE